MAEFSWYTACKTDVHEPRSRVLFVANSVSQDVNGAVSGALRDLAAVQSSTQSRWGYKRAASAIAHLELQLTELTDASGAIPKIPGIGPASTRVIMEMLRSGQSETVERAIAASGKEDEISRRRALRRGFLSRAEVVRVLRLPSAAVGVRDYRGDLQMHSTWSDGVDTIAELAAGAHERGYRFIAITDHSKGLPIAGGLSIERMRAQWLEIDDVNKRWAGHVHVIKGIEANILTDGELDLTVDDLRGVELVLAAPHSKLRTNDDQTSRLIAAINTPGVHVLAHPRGRMSDSRPGVRAEWPRVFAAASERNVAIEIDGDPARQDLDYTLAAGALEAGCLFSLDSDAHDVAAFTYADTALAHARLAGIPAERVINCWPLEKLRDWLSTRSAAIQ
jgi:histidinol phosphatase-like PHP family hydrolase